MDSQDENCDVVVIEEFIEDDDQCDTYEDYTDESVYAQGG